MVVAVVVAVVDGAVVAAVAVVAVVVVVAAATRLNFSRNMLMKILQQIRKKTTVLDFPLKELLSSFLTFSAFDV